MARGAVVTGLVVADEGVAAVLGAEFQQVTFDNVVDYLIGREGRGAIVATG